MWIIPGTRNPKVLPEPVSAKLIISLPSLQIGHA